MDQQLTGKPGGNRFVQNQIHRVSRRGIPVVGQRPARIGECRIHQTVVLQAWILQSGILQSGRLDGRVRRVDADDGRIGDRVVLQPRVSERIVLQSRILDRGILQPRVLQARHGKHRVGDAGVVGFGLGNQRVLQPGIL